MHPYSQPRTVALDKAEALRKALDGCFVVGNTTLDEPEAGYVRFRGRFLQPPADCFDEMRERFEAYGFTPMIREQDGGTVVIALPAVFKQTKSNPQINLWLFIATIFTTLLAGALYADIDSQEELLYNVTHFWIGWDFSLAILLILGVHEMGHYLAARYHNVPVTLPYFIPVPPLIFPIGTLGAFIQLKGPMKNRRALFDVGASGPLAGFAVAIPVFLYGLATSPIRPLPPEPFLYEGNSLIYLLSKLLIFGEILPGNGVDVYLNDVAWAGWFGMLVTGMNLLPLGQLDGGHIAYVLFGKRTKDFFWPIIIGLIGLMVFTGTLAWALWVLLLFWLGRTHAAPLDDVTPLDTKRRLLAYFAIAVFFLVFVPAPFRMLNPAMMQ